jgi:hypothetical protein
MQSRKNDGIGLISLIRFLGTTLMAAYLTGCASRSFQQPGDKSLQVDPEKHTEILYPEEAVKSEKSSQEIRRARPNNTAIGLKITGGIINGAGVEYSQFIRSDTRLTANFEAVFPMGEHLLCSTYLSGWKTLSFRLEQFLSNSFYYGVGPGIQTQQFIANCDPGTYWPGASKPKKSEYGLVGIDAGIGNEWQSESGLYGGCEWAGIFLGAKVSQYGDDLNGHERKPWPITPRLLSCHLGLVFK